MKSNIDNSILMEVVIYFNELFYTKHKRTFQKMEKEAMKIMKKGQFLGDLEKKNYRYIIRCCPYFTLEMVKKEVK